MTDLTISQGLRQIKKLKGQIAELQARAANSTFWKALTPPAFPFADSMDKLDLARASLVDLETRVAVANATTTVTVGDQSVVLAHAVRELQDLKGSIAWVRTLSTMATFNSTQVEYEFDEEGKRLRVNVAMVCALPEPNKVQLVEDLQNRFDLVNGVVENTNHITKI